MAWATFWASFSQIHPATLISEKKCHIFIDTIFVHWQSPFSLVL
jgi:hypothetical protein